MKRLALIFAVTAVVALLGSQASAQSSGSANYGYDATVCKDIGGMLGPSSPVTALSTTLHMSSGNGNTVYIRPSAVVGLLTNLSISGFQGSGTKSASAQAAVTFKVTVNPLSNQGPATVTPSGEVTYDDRFLQISTNLFDRISGCTAASPCFFDLDETTLSAQSLYLASGLATSRDPTRFQEHCYGAASSFFSISEAWAFFGFNSNDFLKF